MDAHAQFQCPGGRTSTRGTYLAEVEGGEGQWSKLIQMAGYSSGFCSSASGHQPHILSKNPEKLDNFTSGTSQST